MRLRYLHIRNLPPLEDVAITFGHERALGRECAVHFIVGVNGSGKSRLLYALSQVLLELENRRLPPFPITLAYDLGTPPEARTVMLRHPGGVPSETQLVDFELIPPDASWPEIESAPWTAQTREPYTVRALYKGDELPGSGSIEDFLPSVLLAYTSGDTNAWERLVSGRRAGGDYFTEAITASVDESQERPPDWDENKELQLAPRTAGEDERQAQQAAPSSDVPPAMEGIGVYVPPKSLKLAFCAVALDQAVKDFREVLDESREAEFIERINKSLETGKQMPGLRGVLNEVDWLWPTNISMRLAFRPDTFTRQRRDELRRLYQVATRIVREPEPGVGRQLVFDLRRPSAPEPDSPSTAEALFTAIGGESATPFHVFSKLRLWQKEGLLEDLTIALRKRNLRDVLLYDWLSDGERAFFGRMALFHLLRGQSEHGKADALILLDEPETHFNDIWKRKIVDIIDESLGNVASNVVITTHSSIVLTDVFHSEITLLAKSAGDGRVWATCSPAPSFGASPGEIMYDIFGAPESVGQRAAKFLDLVLAVAGQPEEARSVWSQDGNDQAVMLSESFARLREAALSLPQDYGSAEQLDRRLLSVLRALHEYAKEKGDGNQRPSMAAALERIEDKLGTGFYQFEFRRRVHALRKVEGI